MKPVATMALAPGMILAEDVMYRDNVLCTKDTVLDQATIDKLNRFSIMCVTVMEDIDYATTHYEKLRFNDNFKLFEAKHSQNLLLYKILMETFYSTNQLVREDSFMSIYNDMSSTYGSGAELLDFIYNLMPNEDELTYNHCLNSALLAGTFAKWVNMSEEETETLIIACFYYDIGKLKLPYDVLWKPGKLTDEEYALVKKHPQIGYDAVFFTPLADKYKNAILMHHERMDGSGYPNRLKGNAIHPLARYIAIIDTYIAMASPRSYRSAMTPLQILGHFEKNMEKYDAELLIPLMKRIGDAQIGTTVQLNDGSQWDVFIIHPTNISRPILKNTNSEILDLTARPDLEIVKNV